MAAWAWAWGAGRRGAGCRACAAAGESLIASGAVFAFLILGL